MVILRKYTINYDSNKEKNRFYLNECEINAESADCTDSAEYADKTLSEMWYLCKR